MIYALVVDGLDGTIFRSDVGLVTVGYVLVVVVGLVFVYVLTGALGFNFVFVYLVYVCYGVSAEIDAAAVVAANFWASVNYGLIYVYCLT